MFFRSLVLMTTWINILLAQSSSSTEDVLQAKAGYLCNFANFVEWPPHSFAWPESPIEICVFGKDAIDGPLQRAIQDKNAGERKLALEHPHEIRQARTCQILFISNSEKASAKQILQSLSGLSVLTVSDMDGFRSMGGTINFVMEGDHVRFEVDLTQAQHAGLKLSSRLLSAARMVISPQGGR